MIIKNEDEWKNFHLKENNARKTTQVRRITIHNNKFFLGNKHHLKKNEDPKWKINNEGKKEHNQQKLLCLQTKVEAKWNNIWGEKKIKNLSKNM